VRIRQIRPEFFTDPTVSRLPVDVRLTYIGLWCVADDAGWLEFQPEHVGAMLYPYESIRVRTSRLERARVALEAAGRVEFFACGCAHIRTLEHHQKIGGNKSFTAREKHDRHRVHTSTDLYPGRYVGSEVGKNAQARDDEKEALIESYRRLGLPVDGAA